MTTTPSGLSIEHVRVLGSDLLRELSQVAGDEEAIGAELARWLDVLGTPDVLMVAAAALQEAFAACVVMVLDATEFGHTEGATTP